MDLDGLLTDAQRLDLDSHLRACQACRADSESFAALTRRLHTGFHSRWDAQDGPSKEIMEHIHSQSRRIVMQKRISFAFNTFGGIVALLVLLFVISSVIAQLEKKANSATGTQTNVPASSTEERLIAFTLEKDGNFDIYTVHADGSNLTNITNSPAKDVNPVWSPDGKRIAFESDRDGFRQIYLMNTDGSNIIQLTNDDFDHTLGVPINNSSDLWSPNGSKLVISQSLPNAEQWSLYILYIETLQKTLIFDKPLPYSSPIWSPDGTHLAFVSDLTAGSKLYVVDSNGNNLTELTEMLPADESPERYLAPSFTWARDGRSVFFTASNMHAVNSASENYKWRVYEAGLDGSLTLHTTTRSPIGGWWDGIYFIGPYMGSGGWTWMYPDGSFNTINPTKECEQERLYRPEDKSYSSAVANFSQSRNGNGIIIASCPDGNVHLSWINSTGTEITTIANLSTAPVIAYLDRVQWSQDDQFIAFQMTPSTSSPLDVDMYIVNIVEALKDPSIPPVKISLGRSEFIYTPAWQPVSDADIAEEKPAPEPEKTSSHNRLLAFTSEQDGNLDIYTLRADGSDLTNLTNNPALDVNPHWSPDGKRIAFESDRDGFMQIYLMNTDGSNVVQLTHNQSDHESSAARNFDPWSPGGSKLILLEKGSRDEKSMLYVMDSNGHNRIALVDEPGMYRSPTWSSDGKHIAFLSLDSQDQMLSRIYVVSTDGSKLTEITKALPAEESPESYFAGGFYWSRDGQSIFFIASNMYAVNNGIGVTDSYKWKVYEASLDGSLALRESTRSPIGSWWQGTYFITPLMGSGGWTWVYPDGSFNTINPTKECEQERVYHPEDKSYRSAVASFSRSPNGNGVIIASCPDGNVHLSWVNPTGTEIIPIAKLSTAPVVEFLSGVQWSQDDKFIAVQINTINNIYMYVLNVDKTKNTPLQALQPILIQTGNNHGRPTYPSLQPMP